MNIDFKARQREREIRERTIDYLMKIFTKNAKDPDRIGRRVLYLQFILNGQRGFPVMTELAERLGVSLSCVSRGVSEREAELEALKNAKPSAGETNYFVKKSAPAETLEYDLRK